MKVEKKGHVRYWSTDQTPEALATTRIRATLADGTKIEIEGPFSTWSPLNKHGAFTLSVEQLSIITETDEARAALELIRALPEPARTIALQEIARKLGVSVDELGRGAK